MFLHLLILDMADILIIFSTIAPRCKLRMSCNVFVMDGGKGILCCMSKNIVNIIELKVIRVFSSQNL